MSDDGLELYGVIKQVRSFFEEIARLLSTADSHMTEVGWKSLTGNSATAELSYSLNTPRQWMPHYLGRFYQHPDRPDLLPFVSILIGVLYDNEDLLKEPLISAGFFDFGNGKKVAEWGIRYSNWHLYIPNRQDDGTVCTVDPRIAWPEEKCVAQQLSSFALPLLSISDSNSLREKVTGPLCKLLSGTRGG